jgi:hypothetical protein
MKTESEWCDEWSYFRRRDIEIVKEIRQEYDEALREKMIQQLWFENYQRNQGGGSMKSAFEVLRDIIGVAIWKERLKILEKWQEEIREDQRKKCFDDVVSLGVRLPAHTQAQIQRAILNASKAANAEVEK